eukprot:gene29851-37236_t
MAKAFKIDMGNQSLDNVGAVLLDEFHERSVEVDLALTLCIEVQQALRADLRLVVMSATLSQTLTDTLRQRMAEAEGPAAVVRSKGRMFPVEVKYAGAPDGGRFGLEKAAARTVKRAMQECQ